MSENETEIVLGNKQLAGIFMVVAVLLGVAFTAGYMVRDRTVKKQAIAAASTEPSPNAAAETASPSKDVPAPGGQTHVVGSDDNGVVRPQGTTPEAPDDGASPLGSRRKKEIAKAAELKAAKQDAPGEDPEDFHPRAGRYLQVVAVSKDEAEAVADVLHKKGFKAHAVPKPGSAKIFRVIIGPVRDAGDLSNTRDALRKTGFREVIVQTY